LTDDVQSTLETGAGSLHEAATFISNINNELAASSSTSAGDPLSNISFHNMISK
jgi:hypothetical protein